MTHAAPLNIWCRSPEAALVIASAFPEHRLLHSLDGPAIEAMLPQAEVVYGHFDRSLIGRCERLKWMHIPNANYARYDKEEFWAAMRARGAVLTNSSTPLADPCVQHMLAMMLGLCRGLPQFTIAQTKQQWRDPPGGEYRILTGATAVILGFGAMGRRLVQLLAPFQMDLSAIRRTVRGDEPIPTFTESELPRLLPRADHIINVLPISNSTYHLLSAERLAMVKRGAYFYNVGRGATVDQDAMREALISGQLGGAYLDVVEPEPLPADHPLWTTPNVHITPHSASLHPARDKQVLDHFLANLRRFIAGQPLMDRIN